LPPPPSSTLFPYTTLFRSDHLANSKHLARSDATVSPICVISTGDDVGRRSRVYGGSECVWHAICEGYGIHGDIVSLNDDLRHHRSEEHTSELQSPCNLVCR